MARIVPNTAPLRHRPWTKLCTDCFLSTRLMPGTVATTGLRRRWVHHSAKEAVAAASHVPANATGNVHAPEDAPPTARTNNRIGGRAVNHANAAPSVQVRTTARIRA